jgi:AraC-like DNA-binding protein
MSYDKIFGNNLIDIEPQEFPTQQVNFTVLPPSQFYEKAIEILPTIYRNDPKFLAMVKTITDRQKYLYDMIRSLVNVYHLVGPTNYLANNVYMEMLARVFSVNFNYVFSSVGENVSVDYEILKHNIVSKVYQINSMGTLYDLFLQYLQFNVYYDFERLRFTDGPTFTKFFKRYTNFSPSAYRKNHKQVNF